MLPEMPQMTVHSHPGSLQPLPQPRLRGLSHRTASRPSSPGSLPWLPLSTQLYPLQGFLCLWVHSILGQSLESVSAQTTLTEGSRSQAGLHALCRSKQVALSSSLQQNPLASCFAGTSLSSKPLATSQLVHPTSHPQVACFLLSISSLWKSSSLEDI